MRSCARVGALATVGHQVRPVAALKFYSSSSVAHRREDGESEGVVKADEPTPEVNLNLIEEQADPNLDQPPSVGQGFLQQGEMQREGWNPLSHFFGAGQQAKKPEPARAAAPPAGSSLKKTFQNWLGLGRTGEAGSPLPDDAALAEASKSREKMEAEDPELFSPSSPVTAARFRLARLEYGHVCEGLRTPMLGMADEALEEVRAGNKQSLEQTLNRIKGEAPEAGLPKEAPTDWEAQSSREVRDGPEVMVLKAASLQLAWLKGPNKEAGAAGEVAQERAATEVSAEGDLKEHAPQAAEKGEEEAAKGADGASPRKVMILLERDAYDPAKRGSMESADLIPVAISKGIDVIVPWVLPTYVDETGESLAMLLDAAVFVLGLESDAVDLNLVVADSMTAPMAKSLPKMQSRSKFSSMVFMNPEAPATPETAAPTEQEGAAAPATDLPTAIAGTPTLVMQGLMAAVEVGAEQSASDAAQGMTELLEQWLTNVGTFYGSQFALQLHNAANAQAPFNAIRNHTLLNEKWLWNFNAAKEGGAIEEKHNLMMIHPAARNMYRAGAASHTIKAYVKKASADALVQTEAVETLHISDKEASWCKLSVAEQATKFILEKAVATKGEEAQEEEEEAVEEETSSCACGAGEEGEQRSEGCCSSNEEPAGHENKEAGGTAHKSEAVDSSCAGHENDEAGGTAHKSEAVDSSCAGHENDEAGGTTRKSTPADDHDAADRKSCGSEDEEPASDAASHAAKSEAAPASGKTKTLPAQAAAAHNAAAATPSQMAAAPSVPASAVAPSTLPSAAAPSTATVQIPTMGKNKK
eukprot:CAMPEP_0178984936 /NCGR_PEP_ID=MMETSP0795-20121207/1886_1 /TAXON_ID=88552 /ORGANISM="Amoebophrya sp., Strain Ameob2" /LENGTH=811 /DNA_ID=CAMNT_0020675863 /DNA_START=183 /DNA_END=2618 /DNA_ORIENTATION=-